MKRCQITCFWYGETELVNTGKKVSSVGLFFFYSFLFLSNRKCMICWKRLIVRFMCNISQIKAQFWLVKYDFIKIYSVYTKEDFLKGTKRGKQIINSNYSAIHIESQVSSCFYFVVVVVIIFILFSFLIISILSLEPLSVSSRNLKKLLRLHH